MSRMTPTSQQITVAGVIAALISAIGFVWIQWREVRTIVEEKPIVAVLAVAAFLLAVAFGVTRSILHRRHMSTRVRRHRG
jgi:hypothetical protein